MHESLTLAHYLDLAAATLLVLSGICFLLGAIAALGRVIEIYTGRNEP